jgi:hypothetical protein
MATIRFQRKNEYLNRIRDYILIVDDEEIGTIANEEIKEFEIPSGQHSVMAKIDWCSSLKLTFELSDNDSKTFTIGAFKNARWLAPLTLGLLLLELALSNSFLYPYSCLLLAPSFVVFLYYITIGYNKFLILKEL